MGKRIVGIVQARMSSSRLPSKVLADIGGKPLLHHLFRRIRGARTLDDLVLATSNDRSDDPVRQFAKEEGVSCYSGSLDDVLDRYYQAAVQHNADVIVRLTGDCPLHDGAIIDQVVKVYLESDADAAKSDETFPDGQDVEVFSIAALSRAWKEAKLPSEREHVGPYVWKHPDLFRLVEMAYHREVGMQRWTVDNPEDLAFVRAVFAELDTAEGVFTSADILDLLNRRPDLITINQAIGRNEGYLKSLKKDELFLSGPSQAE